MRILEGDDSESKWKGHAELLISFCTKSNCKTHIIGYPGWINVLPLIH